MSSLFWSLPHLLTSSPPQHEAPPGQLELLQDDTVHRAPIQSTSSANEPLSHVNFDSGRNPRKTSPTSALPVPPRPHRPLQKPHSSKTSAAPATRSAAKSTPTPWSATGSSWTPISRTSGGHNDDVACSGACARSGGCAPGMFDGIHPNTRHRWKRSAPADAPLGRKTLLVTCRRDTAQRAYPGGVRRPVPVTIHGLAHEWLDAEELDVRSDREWVRRLLRGMRLSCKKPAKCVEELHSLSSSTPTRTRLFVKLCWLISTHAVSADRVNIDEASCRLLPVHQIGWGSGGDTVA